ncbi:MAG: hypothetical protein LBM68_05485 [Bacteroidales bacterium]|jgi:hypothetical protein|nr:hypothetical protein [Bacteroidales bacterium]
MNEYSGDLLRNIVKAPLTEQRITDTGEVWYFGYPKKTDGTQCMIERVTTVTDGTVTQYTTEVCDAKGMFRTDWALRDTYQYYLKTV